MKKQKTKIETPGVFAKVDKELNFPENMNKGVRAELYIEKMERKNGLSHDEFQAKYGRPYQHTAPNLKQGFQNFLKKFVSNRGM